MTGDKDKRPSPYSSEEEYRRGAREEFLSAARQAVLQHRREQSSRGGFASLLLRPRRLATALGAGAGVGMFGLVLAFWFGWFLPAKVEADEFEGVRGIVINKLNNRALRGVEVRVVSVDAGDSGNSSQQIVIGSEDGELVALSDITGSFTLPVQRATESKRYQLKYGDKLVGQIVTGPEERAVQGYYRFNVNVPESEVQRVVGIELTPGEFSEPWPGVEIALDPQASGNWQGNLVNNSSWPMEFMYGRVLDGIYLLDGPEVSGLRIRVRLDAEHLALLHGSVEEVELIQHSDEYAKLGEWRRSFHNGWFVTTKPNYGFTATVEPALEQRKEEAWLSWEAESGAPYALKLPPEAFGQLAWPFVAENAVLETGRSPVASLGLLDLQYPQKYVYFWTYTNKGFTNSWKWPPYENVYLRILSMEDQGCPAEFYNGELLDSTGNRLAPSLMSVPIVLSAGELRKIPGDCRFFQDDFTLCDPIPYGPVSPDFTIPTAEYRLEVGHGELGKLTHCSVQGPLDRLARPVQWDMDNDGVFDTKGDSADLLVSSNGCYPVTATLYDKNGSVLQLKHRLNVSPPEVLGYLPDNNLIDTPVLSGLDRAPEAQTSLLYMSRTAVRSTAGLGWHAGTSTPMIRVVPPQEFREIPLKRLRIVMFTSPSNADTLIGKTSSGFLSPTFTQILSEPVDSRGYFQTNDEMLVDGVNVGFTLAGGYSYIANAALQQHTIEPANGATKMVNQHKENEHDQDKFRIVTGIDLDKQYSEQELVKLLQDFVDSPEFCLVWPEQEKQRCEMIIDLHDWKIPAISQGFLCGVLLETRNVIYGGQYKFHSGGTTASFMELEAESGQVYRSYFDFSPLE